MSADKPERGEISTQESAGFVMPSAAMTVTFDDEEKRHLVSDDQLTLLENTRRDVAVEMCLIGIGACIGLVIPSAASWLKFFDEQDSFSIIDAVQSGLFFAAISASIVLGIVWRDRAHTGETMIKSIRERTKARVHSRR